MNIIEFENIKVGQRAIKHVSIKNTSGIRTRVYVEMENFKAVEIAENERFIDPMKKAPKLVEKFKLNDNMQGMGFGLESSCIELEEFGLASFGIVAVAEIWGSYEDTIKIRIEGIEQETLIPVQINVLDTPIKLFTGKILENDSEEISMLRLDLKDKNLTFFFKLMFENKIKIWKSNTRQRAGIA